MRPKPKIKRKQGKAAGKCRFSNKTMYLTEADAKKGMTLIWGSDPNAKLADLHVYNNCRCGKWHIGHISSYNKYLEKHGQVKQLPNLRGQTVSN